MAVIVGNQNYETLVGTGEDDSIYGLGGFDTLEGGIGADLLDGGTGIDAASYLHAAAGVIADLGTPGNNTGEAAGDTFVSIEDLHGSALDDTLTGDAGSNYLQGNLGSDLLYGGAGNDVLYSDSLYGGVGNDTVFGEAGDDAIFGGGGADYMDGGDGSDHVSYYVATSSVVVDLVNPANNTGDAAGDSLISIEVVSATYYDDTLIGDENANHLWGDSGADAISGGGGNDTLHGGFDGASDTLNGDAGDDELEGLSGDDVLSGGEGNDQLTGGFGADVLNGGEGTDTAVFGGVTVDLSTPANNTGDAAGDTLISIEIIRAGGNCNLVGDASDNTLIVIGGSFSDATLSGGLGADTLHGGEGFDDLQGGAGADLVDGGEGYDFASYAGAAAAVIVDLGTPANSTGDAAGDSFVSIEALRGSAFNDTLVGDGADNVLIGGLGGDVLNGGAGEEDQARYINAVAGLVVDLSNPANNTGEAFGDTFISVENLFGSDFGDTLVGDAGDNLLIGDNQVSGPGGADVLIGGLGADYLHGAAGLDIASYANSAAGLIVDLGNAANNTGEAAGDTLSSIEGLQGSAFDDTLTGDSAANTLSGGAGADTLNGGLGADVLNGGDGDDEASYSNASGALRVDFGSPGTNTGEAAGDTFISIERIRGGNFNDTLIGGAGASMLDGGAGNDVFLVATGAAMTYAFEGGSGTDAIRFTSNSAGETLSFLLSGASGVEEVEISNAAGSNGGTVKLNIDASALSAGIIITGNDGDNSLTGGSGDDTIHGGAGNDTIVGGVLANVVFGGAGDDVIQMRTLGASNALDAGAGEDTIVLHQAGVGSAVNLGDFDQFTGPDDAQVQSGFEHVDASAAFGIALTGGAGDNRLTGSAQDDTISGGDGADTLHGGAGDDSLNGGAGPDAASYAAAGSGVTVSLAIAGAQATGGAGMDALSAIENLIGSAFNDTLTGDAADNVLRGALGADALNGGAGDDLADYSGAAAGLTVNLLNPGNNTGEAAGDTFVSIERLRGSAFNDTLVGDAGGNVLRGGAGADALNGGAGDDTADYRNATASVWVELASPGSNTGEAAGDTFISIEALRGGDFNDTLVGDAGSNRLRGQLGADWLDGGEGFDVAEYVDALSGVKVDLNNWVNNTGEAAGDSILAIECIAGSSFNDTLLGGTANDVLIGGAGNDSLAGGAGVDSADYSPAAGGVVAELWLGTASNDGQGGADTLTEIENLTGGGYDDLLAGDAGNNVLNGGAGTDGASYAAAASGVNLSLAIGVAQATGGAGTDTLISIENLVGSAFNDALGGNAGNNVLDGGGGTDTATYVAAAGAVTVSLAVAGAQAIGGGAGSDTLISIENLTGGGLNDSLTGDGNSNSLSGGNGNDTLDGGAGVDSLIGGLGNDSFFVDNAGDVASEAASEGTDTVNIALDYDIGSNIENITLLGAGNIRGGGNTLNNTINGNTGNNFLQGRNGNDTLNGGDGNDALDGGAGSDNMAGGIGNDAYTVDAASDVCTEAASAGTDLVNSSVDYDIGNNLENITLTGAGNIRGGGNGLDNVFTGNSGTNLLQGRGGNDTLNGGVGVDTMSGGIGNDTYFVDATNDLCSESTGEGTDTVFASVGYNIGNNIEFLTLQGSGNFQGGGNTLDNTILGNSGNNFLQGRVGNDTLDGAGGADTMVGGLGNDTFFVGQTTDVASESVGEGTDTVFTLANYDIQNNIENLTLQGTANLRGGGNTMDNNLLGNSGNNFLQGRVGNDTIDGGTGLDTMVGGAGNDTYFVSQTSDICTEVVGEGTDTVNSLATYNLNNNVEHLNLLGSDSLQGGGNTLDNNILGNSGNNFLQGRAGNDTLNGGAGLDTLQGGADADKFVFSSTDNDILQDFELGIDDVLLDNAVFTQLGADGALDAGRFYKAAGASQGLDADDYLVYNQTSGALYYDGDGTGGAAGQLIATLTGSPDALAATDFVII